MTATLQLSGNPLDQLRTTALGPYAGLYKRYLSDRGYAPSPSGLAPPRSFLATGHLTNCASPLRTYNYVKNRLAPAQASSGVGIC